ncbi:hypothetical protein [Acaryochloris sp. IP29b_bin.137]|uniref:hypothetical protein n=1 Tax=Acaryochloris sp. IP29b_bin.137 TaxID=2969217 RepID=UPI00261153A3|nr:hypothetical protein [Acaryochloris sp. IP29b_bin.137]
MSTNQKFSRQVRNGKVVYVPATPRTPIKPARSQPPRSLHKLRSSLNLLLLAGTTITVVGLAWLSYQVITDPDVAFWLNQYLPTSKGTQTAAHQPRTLQQILKRLQDQKRLPGKPIVLAADGDANSPLTATKDILIPVYNQSCSQRPCQQIQALQVYRSLKLPSLLRLFQGKRYYRLLDRMAVRGPTAEKLANLARNPRLVTGSTRPLHLSRLEVYHPAPKPGSWLRLTGLRSEGSATATYGQILYFHPDEARLVLMLNWASPSGEYPRWRQVTGDPQPELVVKQTVGLEPQFAVYRLHRAPTGDLQMEPISLAKPAFADQGYTQSLLLARSGLWSPAQKKLLVVKKQQPRRWSPKAQAQLDYINLHAAVAQAQSQQILASQVQTIVARLVNGEWSAALTLFQSPQTDPAEVRVLLAADPGRLSARVDAFLGVNPKDQAAIAWGTLIRHVQDDPKTALAWAQQRTKKNKASLETIKKLVKRLDQPRYTPKESPKPPPSVHNQPVKPPAKKIAPQKAQPSGAQLSSPVSSPPSEPKLVPDQPEPSEKIVQPESETAPPPTAPPTVPAPTPSVEPPEE